MTPKVKIFENVFPDSATGHRNTFRDQIWLKKGRCKVAERSRRLTNKKTRAPQDSCQPPSWPKWVDRAQNSPNVVTPGPVHVYRIWSGSAAFCRTYFGKIDFLAQKVNTIQAFSLQISQYWYFRHCWKSVPVPTRALKRVIFSYSSKPSLDRENCCFVCFQMSQLSARNLLQ